jgi:hypothetical protein
MVPARIEALNRYSIHGGAAITVQNVSVGDGGKESTGMVDTNTQTEPEGPIKAGPSELESRLQLVSHRHHDRQPRRPSSCRCRLGQPG